MNSVIVALLCVLVPVVVRILTRKKGAMKQFQCWQAYLEKRKSNKYITISPPVLRSLLYLLEYKITSATVEIRDFSGYFTEIPYGLKFTKDVLDTKKEWVQTFIPDLSLPLFECKDVERLRPTDILIFGRNMFEQQEMNEMVARYCECMRMVKERRAELKNDISVAVLSDVQTQLHQIMDKNICAAQSAAQENQKILERLEASRAASGGSP